jgi:hypothetical protein
MPSIASPTRPDPKYYRNIVQQSDLTWTADEMPLDDTQMFIGPDQAGKMFPGLRTITSFSVVAQAQQLIFGYAPPDLQRNFLNTLATTTSGTPYTNAKAAMDWIASVNSYRDSQVANVKTLTFSQLVAYVIPVGTPPWPTPPSTLPPVAPVAASVAPTGVAPTAMR